MRKRSWSLGAFSGMACFAVLLMAGCDGGGGSSPGPVVRLADAVALAGPDQTVGYGVTVTLDGSKSHAAGDEDDPEGTTPASYAWVKTAGTAAATLSSATAAKPTFTAPSADDTITFQLTAAGKTDTVTVNVVEVSVSVPEVWVGGYGKDYTITPTVSPPDTGGLYSYRWAERRGAPFPLEWRGATTDVAADELEITSPLITDLKDLPADFGILAIGGLSVARANGSRLRYQVTVYDPPAELTSTTVTDLAYDSGAETTTITVADTLTADDHVGEYVIFGTVPNSSYEVTANDATTITVTGDASEEVADDAIDISAILATAPYQEMRAVGCTSGGNVVPIGVPVFINGGAGASYTWIGTAALTQPDGLTSLTTSDRVAMFLPEDPGNYTIVCQVDTTVHAVTIRAASYVGVGTIAGKTPDPDAGECAGCHKGQYANIGDQTTDWQGSAHADVFRYSFVDSDGTGRYDDDDFATISCLTCHVPGFDESATEDNGSFYDVAMATGVDFSQYYETASPDYDAFVKEFPTVADKSEIQCENCHGPGSTHIGDTGGTSAAVLTGACAPCHDDHGVEVRQWERSVHTGVDVSHGTRSGCAKCHAGNGLPAFLRTGESPVLLAEQVGEKGCGTCHDTHALTTAYTKPYLPDAETHNPDRHVILRAEGEVELPNGVSADFGDSAVCAHCHTGRRDVRDGTALAPSAPHHGNQASMVAGTGGFEYGNALIQGPHQDADGPDCASCHMAQKLAHSGRRGDSTTVGGHTWRTSFGPDTATDLASDSVGGYSNPITIAGTREFAVDEDPGNPSFVGLVEVGDIITFDGDDGVTDLPVAAVMSSFSLLVGEAPGASQAARTYQRGVSPGPRSALPKAAQDVTSSATSTTRSTWPPGATGMATWLRLR